MQNTEEINFSNNTFGEIVEVEVNGVRVVENGEVISSIDITNIAGQRVPVFIVFKATKNAQEVVFRAWISGERKNTVETEEIDVLAGHNYANFLFVQMPQRAYDSEGTKTLEIEVESDGGQLGDGVSIYLYQCTSRSIPNTTRTFYICTI